MLKVNFGAVEAKGQHHIIMAELASLINAMHEDMGINISDILFAVCLGLGCDDEEE